MSLSNRISMLLPILPFSPHWSGDAGWHGTKKWEMWSSSSLAHSSLFIRGSWPYILDSGGPKGNWPNWKTTDCVCNFLEISLNNTMSLMNRGVLCQVRVHILTLPEWVCKICRFPCPCCLQVFYPETASVSWGPFSPRGCGLHIPLQWTTTQSELLTYLQQYERYS